MAPPSHDSIAVPSNQSSPPLILVMLRHQTSCWRTHRCKLVLGLVLSLLLAQFIFAKRTTMRLNFFTFYPSDKFRPVELAGLFQQTDTVAPTGVPPPDSSVANHGGDLASNSSYFVDPLATVLLPRINETTSSGSSHSELIRASTETVNNSIDVPINVGEHTANSSQTIAATQTTLELCPLVPPSLVGPIKVWLEQPTFEEIQEKYPLLGPGGHGRPRDCLSRHRVAIIIPYRNREGQLRAFLHNMHSLLSKQQLDYAIYIVEQIADQTFNRAKLMNVGYDVASKLYDWQCFIFHDVDLLPEDDRNLYSCPEQPRHMSVGVDKFNYKLLYADLFGGITAFTKEQFQSVNGYSNDFWGWGGEDDEMASRVKMKYTISRYPNDISRYKMIKHAHESANPVNTCRYNLMYKVKRRWKSDGLVSLKYKLLKQELRPLYTWVLVDLLEKESKQALEKEHVCAGS